MVAFCDKAPMNHIRDLRYSGDIGRVELVCCDRNQDVSFVIKIRVDRPTLMASPSVSLLL